MYFGRPPSGWPLLLQSSIGVDAVETIVKSWSSLLGHPFVLPQYFAVLVVAVAVDGAVVDDGDVDTEAEGTDSVHHSKSLEWKPSSDTVVRMEYIYISYIIRYITFTFTLTFTHHITQKE